MSDEEPVQRWTIHYHRHGSGWSDQPEPFVGTKTEVIAYCAELCVELHAAVNATAVDEPHEQIS